MRLGKTKYGTSITSTHGMRAAKHEPIWILVADRSRLRLFEKESETSEPHLMKEFLSPDGRKKGHELVSDRPGRSFDSQDKSHHGQTGGTRHSFGSASPPEDRAVERVVKEAAHVVEEGRTAESFHRLVIIAEPRLMGLLRKAVDLPADKVTFHEKDFAWLEDSSLEKRLSALS